MFKVDTKNPNPGRWYVDGVGLVGSESEVEEGKLALHLRVAGPQAFNKIVDKHTTTLKELDEDGQPKKQTDWGAVGDDIVDYSLVDWNLHSDKTEKKIQITLKNKLFWLQESGPDIPRVYNQGLREIKDLSDKYEEAEEKN